MTLCGNVTIAEVKADVLEKQLKGHEWLHECICIEDDVICIQMSLSWLNVLSERCRDILLTD